MIPSEEQVLIESGGVGLYGVLHKPAQATRAAVVFCNPLFEERKSAHRPLVEAARYFVERGSPVLRFDYRGCGDSPGEIRDFSIPDWLDDIRAAVRLARDAYPDRPCGLLGVRAGALLAAKAAQDLADVSFLALWQPVVSGGDYLREDLRKKLVKEMITAGATESSRDGLLQNLEEGREIDFDGYPVTARLYRNLGDLSLAESARRWTGRTLVAQVGSQERPSKSIAAIWDAFRAGGSEVEFAAIALPPFWNLVGYVDIAPLIERTDAWLAKS